MQRLLDPRHPFFAKPWRRWVTALLPLAWGIAEAMMGSPGWAVLFGGAGAYAFYVLILHFPKD